MKSAFFRKTAWSNIRKNYRFFIPRILSEAGLLGCFYIALTLAMDNRLSQIKGGAYIPTFMWMGVAVLSLLSAVLVLYTNSFLMKQRKREFGLYNVLGMEKKHVGRVLLHESLISSVCSVFLGLGLGVLFYKLCSLLICRLLKASVLVGFYFITPKTLVPSGLAFFLLDVFTYFINRITIARMKPVELLASQTAGEKEPKVRFLLLIIGILTLGTGYTLALVTKSPLEALGVFFLAVILVIIGTYCLFVSGSIFVLKLLKKNRKFYYQPSHMPAVSGLLYRMKQNAVGLASISILATGVLVMISSTVSLYAGLQGTLNRNYPQHLYLDVQINTEDGNRTLSPETMEELVNKVTGQNGVEVEDVEFAEYLQAAYVMDGNTLYSENEAEESGITVSLSGITNFIFITEDTYTYLTGEILGLKDREIGCCRIASTIAELHELNGELNLHGRQYVIARQLISFPISSDTTFSAFTTYGIVVSDRNALDEILQAHQAAYGANASEISRRFAVTFTDLDKACEVGGTIESDLFDGVKDLMENDPDVCGFHFSSDSYWQARENLLGMYGTLLFLGILLGAVCLFATVLIIYYKQISEGYEDRHRFQIMEKIGMSRNEVRKTISTQVLLVFFLPLLVAGVHMLFAFPLISRLLNILALYRQSLLLECSLITYAVFALVYVLIFRGTSRTYYKIVH